MAFLPFLIGGGIAAAGSVAGAGIGAASNAAGRAADAEARAAELERLGKIALPRFGSDEYFSDAWAPNKYAAPEDAQYQLAEVDPRIRDQQMAALGSLQDRFNGVADAQQNAESYAAMGQANRMAQGRQGAIQQNAAARGMGGSGLEFVMQQQAAQDGANRAQAGTMQAAQMAAMQKLAGQQAYLQGMGNFRGQEFNQAAQNADTINRFNMHNTDARNNIAMGNTDAENKAGLFNLQNKASNRAGNIDRGDRIANTLFGDEMAKAGGANAIDSAGSARDAASRNRDTAIGIGAIQSGTNLAGQMVAGWGENQKPQAYDSSGQPSTKYDWERWGGR